MKHYSKITAGILACLLLAAATYFWINAFQDSLYNFRSPLHGSPPVPGKPLGEPLTRRVVFVLVDALRLDTSLQPEVMPFLNELRWQGAAATMHSRPPSYSAPSYSVLLTGAWPDLSDGPAFNLDYAAIPAWTQDNLFSAARRAGLQTAVSGYYWFEKLIPHAAVSASFYTPGEDQVADRQVIDAALPWLRDGGYQFVLIHLDQVDYAGHYEGGPRSPGWAAAARRVDGLLREIAAPLDLRQDTLLVLSDHGQIDRGGHGGHDRVVLIQPFVLVGAGVRPGQYGDLDMVDAAPTLAVLLGLNLPASGQGRPRLEMLELAPVHVQTVQAALAQQQGRLLEVYQAAIGRPLQPAEPGQDAVLASQAALQAARTARLTAERLPRAGLALLVMLLLVAWLWRRRGPTLAWLLGGAAVYLLLFNLRYRVIDARQYSFSSVTGADELLLYCAGTALLALLAAWLVILPGLRPFRAGPRRSAELALQLALVCQFFLLFPVLWNFVQAGPLLTWTLPDIAGYFLALLSAIQVLVVGLAGPALAGLSALVVRLYMSKRWGSRAVSVPGS